MRKKLKEKLGETIGETLVAILVIALAASLLATMSMAATRITSAAKENSEEFYSKLAAVETGSEIGPVVVTINGVPIPGDIKLYGEVDGLKSYRKGD